MSVTAFETPDAGHPFEYQWVYANQTVNGTPTFGVSVLPSYNVHGNPGFNWGESSVFYMMTWNCPPPNEYFNLTTR